jgi:hypothetical protein
LPELGIEGWPIKWNELQQHYLKVIHELVGEELTDEEFIREKYALQKQIVNSQGLELRLFRFADEYSFKKKYETLKQSSNLIVSTGNRVDEIATTQSGNHEELSCILTNESGRRKVIADRIIVAAGSMQSTKLILNSKDLHPPRQKNVAGTGLMEHMEGFVGVMKVSKSKNERLKLFLLNHKNRTVGSKSGFGIRLGTELIKEHSLTSFHVELRPLTRNIYQPKKLLRDRLPNPLHLIERIVKYVFSIVNQSKDFICRQTSCGLWVKVEELRNSESIIRISTPEKMNKTLYKHLILDESFEKLFVNLDLILQPMIQIFESRVKLKGWVRRRIPNPNFGVNWHPMGTLSMGENPETAVCNKNLALHSNKKVFLLSAAVFNRGSNSNPTTTVLALASRLVEEQF